MRSSTLDILRAVAVLLVYGDHTIELPVISAMGWVGVDLFFVLSGFLVSGLLFREYQQTQQIRSGRFLLRRGFKIYPQFYLMIGLTALIARWDGHPVSTRQIAAEALFVQNYFQGFWIHSWSLAIEEHFYILLVIGIAFLAGRGGNNPFEALPKWISLAIASILLVRVATWWFHPGGDNLNDFLYLHNFPSHLRMDSLLAGVLLSYYHVFHLEAVVEFVQKFRSYLAPASILMLAPMAFLSLSHPFVYTLGFSMLWMGFSLLLLIGLYPDRPAAADGFASRAMARLGRCSYAFYLWHLPVRLMIHAATGALPASVASVLFTMAVTFGATLLAAFATTWAVETPFLRLRDRWVPSAVKSPLFAAPPPEAMVLQAARAFQPLPQIRGERT